MEFPYVDNDLNNLWGGYVDRFEFEMCEQRIVLYVTALDGGLLKKYDVVMNGVMELHMSYISGDDDLVRLELTAITAISDANGFLDVSCELWSMERTLDVKCSGLCVIRRS